MSITISQNTEFNHGVVEGIVISNPTIEAVNFNSKLFVTSFIIKVTSPKGDESNLQAIAFRRSADSVIRSVRRHDGIRIDAKLCGYTSRSELLLERFELISYNDVSSVNRFYVSTNKIQILEQDVMNGVPFVKFKLYACVVEGQQYCEVHAIAFGERARLIVSFKNLEYLYFKCSLVGSKNSFAYTLNVEEILRIV